MRRVLLVLTVISFAGRSQPAQQQAQAPIVVKVEMPPTPHRDFLGYLQALGPLIAASVAVGVSLVQRNLQQRQLKQDLFTKRYTVYAAVGTFLTNVINSGGAMDERAVHAFRFETAHAEFLFGKDVVEFIGLVFGRSMDVAVVKAQIDRHVAATQRFQRGESNTFDVPAAEMLADMIPSHTALLNWFITAQVQCNTVFRPALQLHWEQAWYSRLKANLDRWMESADGLMKSRYDA